MAQTISRPSYFPPSAGRPPSIAALSLLLRVQAASAGDNHRRVVRYSTLEEEFWAGAFGTSYIERNRNCLPANLDLFARGLKRVGRLESCIELGANIGLNLRALKLLHPELRAQAVEINPDAQRELRGLLGPENIFAGSILDWKPQEPAQLAFTKGVLIHIAPDRLPRVYDKLYASASRWIFLAEYYSPQPCEVPYRGNAGKLYKRDFAGDMLDRFHDLSLADYGFSYHRDPAFPHDDVTWFLLKKSA